MAADVKNSITGAATLALRSVLLILVRVVAGAVHLLYGYLDNIIKQLFTETAESTYLDKIGSEIGLIRKAPVAAAGIVAITGVALTVVPAGSELQSTAGNIYTTDEEVTIPVAATIDAAITAQATGTASNDTAGIELTFVSPIVDVDTIATVDANGITDGLDEEIGEDYRARIRARKRLTPHGGAEHDILGWVKEVPGVTRAWLVKQYQGAGTILVLFTRDNDASIYPDATEIAEVRTHLISHTDIDGNEIGIPVTMQPGLFIAAPTPKTVDMTIGIYPNNSTVQAQILAELADLFYEEAGPEETLYLSRISEAISRAEGESRHTLILPAADVTATATELHVLGDVTFQDY
jgi:uncharacterized phage protein gp47/JayE